MKELKPNKYTNFKQTIIVKNQINTVNGKLMLNTNTTASTRATHTFTLTQAGQDWLVTKQENIAGPDNAGNKHCMAKSIVGCGVVTLTHDFELDTPIVSTATVNITLGGKTYKLATNTHAWNEGSYDNIADAVEFIINHSQHTESTWASNSEYVSYENLKVPLFAWVKDASYLVDYEHLGGKSAGWENKDGAWQPNDDVKSKLPPSSNQITPWLTNAWAISGNTGFKASNCSGSVWAQNRGYWTQNGEKVQDKMMYPSPLPNYSISSSELGSGPTSAFALTLSFRPVYRDFDIKVQRLDTDGYRWRVIITIPRFYAYLAICRAAQVHIFGSLSFNNSAADCPSLGFVDYIESAQVDLIGEVLDESTTEFSQVLDESGNPIAGERNHIKRLSNNELLTQDTSVASVLNGKVSFQILTYFAYTVTHVGTDGEYEIFKNAIIDKDSVMYDVIKKNIEAKSYLLKVREYTSGVSTFFPGDVYESVMTLDDTYSDTQARLNVSIKGISSNATDYAQCYVFIYGYAEEWFTGSWKDWATELLVNNYEKGKIVINCEVEAPYILENDGLKINDLVKFKDIYNQWISRNNRVIYFEVKNIRKIFENSKYSYQLTLIESNYGEQTFESIRLIDYSDYTQIGNYSNAYVLSLYNKSNAETGYYYYYDRSYNLNTFEDPEIDQYDMIFEFQKGEMYALEVTAMRADHINIDSVGAPIEYAFDDIGEDGIYNVLIVRYETVGPGTLTNAILNSVLVKYTFPNSFTPHDTPYVKQNNDYASGAEHWAVVSTLGRAITTSVSLGLDSGFVRIENYDEFNDCIVFVIRCPIWALNSGSVNKERPVEEMGEIIESAGFFERYSTNKVSALMFKTLGHMDSGPSNLLYDFNYEYLLDSEDRALEVNEDQDINYEGMYLVAVLKPNIAQMANGIVPFIKQKSTSHLNSQSYVQGQYYHIKGMSIENMDVLWNKIINSGELNNYHDEVYPLPSID